MTVERRRRSRVHWPTLVFGGVGIVGYVSVIVWNIRRSPDQQTTVWIVVIVTAVLLLGLPAGLLIGQRIRAARLGRIRRAFPGAVVYPTLGTPEAKHRLKELGVDDVWSDLTLVVGANKTELLSRSTPVLGISPGQVLGVERTEALVGAVIFPAIQLTLRTPTGGVVELRLLSNGGGAFGNRPAPEATRSLSACSPTLWCRKPEPSRPTRRLYTCLHMYAQVAYD